MTLACLICFCLECSLYMSLLNTIYFLFISFFFNDTATTEIYTLSLHDALPILKKKNLGFAAGIVRDSDKRSLLSCHKDRKSTRLNSSHSQISYAVFCLKKKKTSSYCSSPKTYPTLSSSLLHNLKVAFLTNIYSQ